MGCVLLVYRTQENTGEHRTYTARTQILFCISVYSRSCSVCSVHQENTGEHRRTQDVHSTHTDPVLYLCVLWILFCESGMPDRPGPALCTPLCTPDPVLCALYTRRTQDVHRTYTARTQILLN